MGPMTPPSSFPIPRRVAAVALLTGPALWAAALSAAAPPLPTDVTALGWLAGNWTGTTDGVEMEEVWLSPKGGARRSLYWLDGAGALHARVEGAGGADPEEWTWRRSPPSP